jgi:phosphoribosylaminoimidazole carboxylase (NCAIR synthetase)
MTHQAAVTLGQSLRVLAADPADAAAPVVPDVEFGRQDDLAALRRIDDNRHYDLPAWLHAAFGLNPRGTPAW